MLKNFSICFLIFLSSPSLAQDSLLNVEVEDVMITATRIASELTKSPVSVHSLNSSKVIGSQEISVIDDLRKIPGIYAVNQYNSAQDLRLSIRGFGARSAFGIRGIKLIMDGIPLTTPDGQGQLDNILVSGIKKIETLNGASSSLYGNASGGVIQFSTFENNASTENNNEWFINYGSFNSLLLSGETQIKKGQWVTDQQISYHSTRGFRTHSASRNFIYNGRVKKTFNNGGQAQLILNYLNSPTGEDPGGVNLATVNEEKTAAREQNVLFNAGEELSQFTSGLSYELDISPTGTIKLNSYYVRRDFENRLPFENGGQVDLLRNYGGGGVQYLSKANLRNWNFNSIIGLEIGLQQDNRMRYFNLEGVRGTLTLSQEELFSNQAIYISSQAEHGRWLINTGLRYDNNVIRLKDAFESDGVQDGNIDLSNLSPNVSFSYRLAPRQYIRSAFSYGFETPTLSELGNNPDGSGGFNENLLPQQSYNYEVGHRGRWTNYFSTNVALFYIESEDELLPFEVEDFPGRVFYRNSGTTTRRGIEFALESEPLSNLMLGINYTYSDFRFADFEGVSGNFIPGIPQHSLGLNTNYGIKNWTLNFSFNYYSSLFADNENSTSVPSYRLANANISYKIRGVRIYAGIHNLLNSQYYDNIRINAFGGRFYEAAPPRNFYIGVKFDL